MAWPLSTKSHGVKRLSLVCGLLVALVLPFWTAQSGAPLIASWIDALMALIVGCFGFLTGWTIVRTIVWIISGFVLDKAKNPG